MTTNRRSSTIGVLRILLIVVFVTAGIPKLLGFASAAQSFEQFGYPLWFRVAVGVAEIAGAFLLLRPSTLAAGTYLLGTVMVGAIYTLINEGDFREALVPAVVLCTLAYVGAKTET